MKFFEASVGTIITRFYIMMAVALIAGFARIPWLALLCIPLFLSAMLGVKFNIGNANATNQTITSSNAKHLSKAMDQAA